MTNIEGVEIIELKTHPDDRGYFREIFRSSHGKLTKIAQISATMSYANVIKAFHFHKKQDDLWYCAKGMIQAVLYDQRQKSKTYRETQVIPMGDHKSVTLFIPKGVVHGYKVLGSDPALVIYATSKNYDLKDELRLPYDDPQINFDWNIKPR